MTALGRQALAVTARWLRDDGISGNRSNSLLVPWFSCQTMITPWQLEGYRVHRLSVGDDFQLDASTVADALAVCRRRGERPAVLACETFGIQPGAELVEVLQQARHDAVPVVVDRTHSFLGPSRTPADIEVTSTRKLLPLAEVAWVRADEDLSYLVGNRSDTDVRVTAARRRFLKRRGLDTFEVVEDLADDCWAPVPPDDDACAEFATFDRAEFARRVQHTRDALLEGLGTMTVVNPTACCATVLSHPGADGLADQLRKVGVVGPLHWDRPQHLDVDWPEDLVSLPPVMDEATIDRVIDVTQSWSRQWRCRGKIVTC
ncbi:hypothetical protein FYJ43_08110 [Cutibacterium sp. WCA-380-WT-3A]|uniref:DegT/DnrJ/EryC1/StrS aminotransferase family protein n=1 Tax=Cutibacterium porci TaxID=2605781 RepID=A0A7K0J7R1_9ACTN|nr:hypothetical protein [Cutibacterium porci]